MKAKNYFAHLNMNAPNRISEKQQDKKITMNVTISASGNYFGKSARHFSL